MHPVRISFENKVDKDISKDTKFSEFTSTDLFLTKNDKKDVLKTSYDTRKTWDHINNTKPE